MSVTFKSKNITTHNPFEMRTIQTVQIFPIMLGKYNKDTEITEKLLHSTQT